MNLLHDSAGSPATLSVADRDRARARKRFAWICTIAGLLFVIVFQQMPISYFSNAAHDDGWFVAKALSIASGNWLGPYNQFALMKGPGYPLFLVLVSASGLPVAMAEALLFAFALGLLCWVLGRLTDAWRLCAVLYVLTLWHPLFLVSRIIRDAIYPAQLFLLLAFAIAALLVPGSFRRMVAYSVLFGLAAGWFWLTREEGIWILPGLGVLALAALIRARRDRPRQRRLGIGVGVMILSAVSPVAAFGLINKVEYGMFQLVDFKDSGFTAALDALYSVQVGDPTVYVPVPKRARLKIYEVSPHFAELRDALDIHPAGWIQAGCVPYPQTCGDYAGGWFFWALRDAAASAGKFATATKASQFFADVAAEVRSACAAATLTCRKPLASGLPYMTAGQLAGIVQPLLLGIASLSLADKERSALQWHSTRGLSSGTSVAIEQGAKFLNAHFAPAAIPEDREYDLAGWYMDPGYGWMKIVVRTPEGTVRETEVPRAQSPDLVDAFHDSRANLQRFTANIRCAEHCTFEVRGPDTSSKAIDIATLHAGMSLPVGTGQFYLDNVDAVVSTTVDPRPRLANGFRLLVARVYTYLGPLFLIGGSVCFFVALPIWWQRRRSPPEWTTLLLVAGVFWLLVVTRLVLLALVHVSLFPAVNPLYMIPAYYLTTLAAGLSLYCCASAAIAKYRRVTPASLASQAQDPA